MARLTVCPHYLTDYKLTSPDDIEREIIGPLANCLSKAIELGIEIAISKELLDQVVDGFPWNKAEDSRWRKYLDVWYRTIFSFLGKAKFISTQIEQSIQVDRCSLLQPETIRLFSRFLALFGCGKMHDDKHEESILCNASCNYGERLGSFYLLKSTAQLDYVLYPWLRLYPKPLPPKGSFKFTPPSDWRNYGEPRRGAGDLKEGYLDDKGNVWIWDRKHDNHWDVQLSTGGYRNVSESGEHLW
jgi:hypothetical protein